MKAFIFATMREARPFLQNLGLKNLPKKQPPEFFEITKSEVLVCICGMGKDLASTSIKHLLDQYNPDTIFNVGIAGALSDNFSLGDVVQVEKTISWPSNNNYQLELYPALNLPVVTLITSPNPVFDSVLRNEMAAHADIVDMECSHIAKVCLDTKLPFYSIKAISDFAKENERARLFENIDRLAVKLSETICKVVDNS